MTKLSDIFGVSFNEIVQQEKALTDKIAYNESLDINYTQNVENVNS